MSRSTKITKPGKPSNSTNTPKNDALTPDFVKLLKQYHEQCENDYSEESDPGPPLDPEIFPQNAEMVIRFVIYVPGKKTEDDHDDEDDNRDEEEEDDDRDEEDEEDDGDPHRPAGTERDYSASFPFALEEGQSVLDHAKKLWKNGCIAFQVGFNNSLEGIKSKKKKTIAWSRYYDYFGMCFTGYDDEGHMQKFLDPEGFSDLAKSWAAKMAKEAKGKKDQSVLENLMKKANPKEQEVLKKMLGKGRG